MKQLIVSVAIIVALIAFFVIIDHKEFSRHDDVQTVQSESSTTNRKPTISIPETKSMTEVTSDEIKQTQTPSANRALFRNNSAPAAIPVLTPEEALKANMDAVRQYNKIKTQDNLKKFILVSISILCVVVLLFTNRPYNLNHIHSLQVLDFMGWGTISFVVMYCVLLIFQIKSPGREFLVSLQPILTTPSLYLFIVTFLLFIIAYIKFILPLLLHCKLYKFLLFELVLATIIGGFVIDHFSIKPISDFATLLKNANEWQALSPNRIKEIVTNPSAFFHRRCYFSYYMIYHLFGCNYIFIEVSQLFMHLVLGINVYFLAKQCVLREKVARLSMVLYFIMPVQYLYLTIPSLDLWGGMLLSLNANLIIYLFKKSLKVQLYNPLSIALLNHTFKSNSHLFKIRCYLFSLFNYLKCIPCLFPLLISIILGITLFWMEMVRNILMLLCIPMFLFLSAVLVRNVLAGEMKLLSQKTFFIALLCLFVPFLSYQTVRKTFDVPQLKGDAKRVTAQFNTPGEIREVIRFGDFYLIAPKERLKDFALDAATSFWNLYPSEYALYFSSKVNWLSDLNAPTFVATKDNIKEYPKEFTVYTFIVWIIRFIFMPLLLVGILYVLFCKQWNSFTYIPIVLFFFFFFIMPTVGECQERYTTLFYSPMCVCAACTFLICKNTFSSLKKDYLRTRFVNSLLFGVGCLIILLFGVTLLFSSPSFSAKHQWINFHEAQRELSSGDYPVAYKEYTDRNYLLSCVFCPAITNVIPEKTYVEWIINEQTIEGHEYFLYGFLIAPPKHNADFVVKINGAAVWDNSAFSKSGVSYSNSIPPITNEKIIFLDNLKFTAEKENVLRVEIIPKKQSGVDFALSSWGMLPCK